MQEVLRLRENHSRDLRRENVLSVIRGDMSPVDFFAYLVNTDIKSVNAELRKRFDLAFYENAKDLQSRKDRLQQKAMFFSPVLDYTLRLNFEEVSYSGSGIVAP